MDANDTGYANYVPMDHFHLSCRGLRDFTFGGAVRILDARTLKLKRIIPLATARKLTGELLKHIEGS